MGNLGLEDGKSRMNKFCFIRQRSGGQLRLTSPVAKLAALEFKL
jgi:hypothetical protein